MTHVKYDPKHKWHFKNKTCKCGGTIWGIAKMICQSGQIKYPWYCRECGEPTTMYEPKNEWLIFTAVINYAGPLQCEKCGMPGAEWHHWAPREYFGPECEEWPQSPLCQRCHSRWHKIVTPQHKDCE